MCILWCASWSSKNPTRPTPTPNSDWLTFDGSSLWPSLCFQVFEILILVSRLWLVQRVILENRASFCCTCRVTHFKNNNVRPWQNNSLVPVTYGPESRVGRSGKYFILDKNFISPIYRVKWPVQNSEALTSHTHTHTMLTTRCIESELAWYAAFRQFSIHFGLKYTCRTISFLIQVKIKPKNV